MSCPAPPCQAYWRTACIIEGVYVTFLATVGGTYTAFRIVTLGVERFPGDTGSLAIQGVAAAVAGHSDIARTLNDFDGLMWRVRIAPPSGWSSVAEFNAALAEHVENHPSVQFAPADHAT